jgi:transcriptional regulator GlxA family with amidase domain
MSAAPTDPALLRRLLRARDRVAAAPHERWSVARLAKLSGVSPAHFARSFHAAFGAPPHRVVLSLRLERAAALLRDTDLPIAEVALASGWRSPGSFGRTFSAVLGLSPSAHRAQSQAARAALAAVPPCFLQAGARPDLTIAVSEKRRRQATE